MVEDDDDDGDAATVVGSSNGALINGSGCLRYGWKALLSVVAIVGALPLLSLTGLVSVVVVDDESELLVVVVLLP